MIWNYDFFLIGGHVRFADGSIVPCATDLSVVIAATLELIIAHIEKAGKDGGLNGDDKLAAASAFLLAVADLNEIEKATGLGAADTAHLRLCGLLMNPRLQGTNMNELSPTLRILMYISGSANITGITKAVLAMTTDPPKRNTNRHRTLVSCAARCFVSIYLQALAGEPLDTAQLPAGKDMGHLENWSFIVDKSRVFAVTGVKRAASLQDGGPQNKNARKERYSIMMNPKAQATLVLLAPQVYLPIVVNGKTVNRNGVWDDEIYDAAATACAKVFVDEQPNKAEWTERVKSVLKNQKYVKTIKPHLEEMKERKITYAQAEQHIRVGKYGFYLTMAAI